MNTLKPGLALAAFALVLSACSTTEYVYTPPDSAEGRACVARCQDQQQACRRENERAAQAFPEELVRAILDAQRHRKES